MYLCARNQNSFKRCVMPTTSLSSIHLYCSSGLKMLFSAVNDYPSVIGWLSINESLVCSVARCTDNTLIMITHYRVTHKKYLITSLFDYSFVSQNCNQKAKMSDWVMSDFKRAGGINKKTEVRLLGKLSSLRTQLKRFDNLFVFEVFETDKILTFQTNQ